MENRIKMIELNELATRPGPRRKVMMNGPKFHTWLHVYKPGDKDEMHSHNADQTFYCIEGECTMHFPDHPSQVLKPEMIALIPGGSFYQLENTGEGRLMMIGSRGLSDEASMKIDHITRKNISPEKGEIPKATKVLV